MDREKLLAAVREQVTEHRYQHTLGVMETAIALARKYGVNEKKAETAAILHDYCKFWPEEKMRKIIKRTPHIEKDLLDYDKELWHAPVGAEVVKQTLGIQDEKILNAIRYHTSGREKMKKLEKVVCLADYIEPNRIFPGVEEIRQLAENDIDAALIKAFGNTITFLVNRGKKVYPLTVMARNSLLAEQKNVQEELK
ncbi:bis(5'-nucleosyl)-tetraphosphatase (symmetrical) YqeK [Aneurinibacillus terranovensis]|uniref:bis(5'-nucleosyl)-tetraphosphatase (symmetrical) YqeK n=1 Tax=Aneurinibacillus terranovensis TaxID=278991 RepID=UPI000402756E|nr:bis(5'-nucleosyl)-tetraphosphatase (symmetrical) YqeK [Aneurinibacillus terranovensis]